MERERGRAGKRESGRRESRGAGLTTRSPRVEAQKKSGLQTGLCVGARGFEPRTSRTRTVRAKPSCATPRTPRIIPQPLILASLRLHAASPPNARQALPRHKKHGATKHVAPCASGRGDLNPGLPGPKPGALTKLRYAPSPLVIPDFGIPSRRPVNALIHPVTRQRTQIHQFYRRPTGSADQVHRPDALTPGHKSKLRSVR